VRIGSGLVSTVGEQFCSSRARLSFPRRRESTPLKFPIGAHCALDPLSTMDYRKNLDIVAGADKPVYYPVVAIDDFSNGLAVQLRNNPSTAGQFLKFTRGGYEVFNESCGVVVGISGDVGVNCLEVATCLIRPVYLAH